MGDAGAGQMTERTAVAASGRGVEVIDRTALSLRMLNNLSMHVFELAEGNIRRVAAGERVGTVISTSKEKR